MKMLKKLLIIGLMIGICIGMKNKPKQNQPSKKHDDVRTTMNSPLIHVSKKVNSNSGITKKKQKNSKINHVKNENVRKKNVEKNIVKDSNMNQNFDYQKVSADQLEALTLFNSDIYDQEEIFRTGSFIDAQEPFYADLNIIEEEDGDEDEDRNAFRNWKIYQGNENTVNYYEDQDHEEEEIIYDNQDIDATVIYGSVIDTVKEEQFLPVQVLYSFLDPYNNVLNKEFEKAFGQAREEALNFLEELRKYGKSIDENAESGVQEMKKTNFFYATSNQAVFKMVLHTVEDLESLIGYVNKLSVQFYTDFYTKYMNNNAIPFPDIETLLFAIKETDASKSWEKMQNVEFNTYVGPILSTDYHTRFQKELKKAKKKTLCFLEELRVYDEEVKAGLRKSRISNHFYATSNQKIFKLVLCNSLELEQLIKNVRTFFTEENYIDFYMKYSQHPNQKKMIPLPTVETLLFAIKGAKKWNEMQPVLNNNYSLYLYNAFPISTDLVSLIDQQAKTEINEPNFDPYSISDIIIYQDLKKFSEVIKTKIDEYKASFLADFTAGKDPRLENNNLSIMKLHLTNQNPVRIESFAKLLRSHKLGITAREHNIRKYEKSKNK